MMGGLLLEVNIDKFQYFNFWRYSVWKFCVQFGFSSKTRCLV